MFTLNGFNYVCRMTIAVIVVGLVLSGFSPLVASASTSLESTATKHNFFAKILGGFSIKLPSGWVSLDQRAVFVPAGVGYEGQADAFIKVVLVSNDPKKELWKKSLVDFERFRELNKDVELTRVAVGKMTIDGGKAVYADYEKRDVKYREILLWNKGTFYYLNVVANNGKWDVYGETMLKSINTIKVSAQPLKIKSSSKKSTKASVEKNEKGWKTYKNSDFSISYPAGRGWVNDDTFFTLGGAAFGTPQSMRGGYIWVVGVYSKDTVSIESVIKRLGSQFEDRKESRKKVRVDGMPATFVTVTTEKVKNWKAQMVIVDGKEVGRSDRFYVLSGGANDEPGFDRFYQSFRLLPQKELQSLPK